MPVEPILYVTSSRFKREEAEIIRANAVFKDGVPVRDLFTFQFQNVSINEILEVDLRLMVQDEVIKAYHRVRLPCIVEHAGLIFEDYEKEGYPGGLTKPMWDTLGNRFLSETASKNRRALARAVVAYCDGASVKTFVGETRGTLADTPRGSRTFYWDTVFIPDASGSAAMGKTYAEIVEDPALGLRTKVLEFSQSMKAIMNFLEHRRDAGPSPLWR